MNKDELLKIYSAYLPYNLNVQLSAKDTYKNGVFPLIGIRNDGLFYMGESGMFGYVQLELGTVKPILYDLSYLTKPIEHEGVEVIPIDYISHSKANSQRIMRRYANGQSLDVLEQWQFERLLQLHLNVLNLPESEFINKATLTQKQ